MAEEAKEEQNVPQVDKVDDESLDQVTNGGRVEMGNPSNTQNDDTKNKFD